MNRRNARFFVLAASSLLVVGLFAGREMASWRPQKLERIASARPMDVEDLFASGYVVADAAVESQSKTGDPGVFFDVRNNKTQRVALPSNHSMGAQGRFSWQAGGSPFRLQVSDENNQKKTFVYQDELAAPENTCVRVLSAQNTVVVLDGSTIYRWKFDDQKVGEVVDVEAFSGGGEMNDLVLSRDAHTFYYTDKKRIFRGDTSTGKTSKTTPLRGVTFFEDAVMSPYGRYAFYDQPGAPFAWKVVDTSTGKGLWSFSIPPRVSPLWAVADDETTIVVPADKEWQVRSLATGAALRRLPFVPGATVAALSPDGKALYSVAKGVLYRQRAR